MMLQCNGWKVWAACEAAYVERRRAKRGRPEHPSLNRGRDPGFSSEHATQTHDPAWNLKVWISTVSLLCCMEHICSKHATYRPARNCFQMGHLKDWSSSMDRGIFGGGALTTLLNQRVGTHLFRRTGDIDDKQRHLKQCSIT